ncbi:sortase [Embleya sp. NPDC056575]|uniref:sortase n=1 Tax=unclassified Embleya TaxID=2699296 RepID=UPI0036A51121
MTADTVSKAPATAPATAPETAPAPAPATAPAGAGAGGHPPATAGGARASRADPYTVAGAAVALLALLIAGFVGYVYVVSDIQQARDQSILADRLSDELYRDVAPLGGTIAKGRPVAMLRIPAIGLRQVVVEGTTADSLAKGPGHLRTSGLPGQGGHSVIMGRAYSFGGPFHDLDDLRVGQRVEATTQQGDFTYKVIERRHIANGKDDVLAPGRENRLVLITADSWIRPGGRTVVVAELQGAPKAQEGRRPQGLRADEKGTGGYANAGVRLLLWAQAFTIVVAVLVWALRRHPDRRVTLLLGTPVVLAVVWALYESAARVLPATL